MEIKCTKCLNYKDSSEFRERVSLKRGFHFWCKECERSCNKSRYVPVVKVKDSKLPKPKEIIKKEAKERQLKHRYSLSIQDYNLMYKEQGESCAICLNKYPLGGYKGVYVDHCHTTGLVRGLLCPSCNSALGKFKDDVNILTRAINYLLKENK